jgi:ribosomal protein S18 acetylase RimI-like enzyme
MANPGDITGIEFGPMEMDECDAICDLIAGSFSRDEPMAVAVGQGYAEFQAMVGLFLADAGFRESTIRARQTGSGELVGVMLATDFTTALPAGVETASPSFPPVGGVIGRLEEWYREARSPRPGECLDLAMLAVGRGQGGRGIAQKLVSVSLERAAAQGFDRAITMATNRTSQHVFQKLGFKELFSVSYKDYTFAGNRVFAAIEPDDRTALMERVL